MAHSVVDPQAKYIGFINSTSGASTKKKSKQIKQKKKKSEIERKRGRGKGGKKRIEINLLNLANTWTKFPNHQD